MVCSWYIYGKFMLIGVNREAMGLHLPSLRKTKGGGVRGSNVSK